MSAQYLSERLHRIQFNEGDGLVRPGRTGFD